MECSWCGDADPLVDSDTQESFPVVEFDGEFFHKPCFETYNRYNTLRDAIKATGWTRDEFLMNVDLLAGEFKEDDNG